MAKSKSETTMQSEPVIVVLQGGCVLDVLGAQNHNIFDWDDFDDDPIAYWDDHGSSGSEYWATIESLSPELYKSVEKRIALEQTKAE